MDLAWTGTQFLDPREHSKRIVTEIESIDLTTKDEVWAEGVAAALAEHYGLRPGSVRVTAGATQMIDVLLRGLVRDLVVDVVPNFHLTATVCRQNGWNHQAVAVREPGELLPALEPYLDVPGAVFSLSSPRNPLGYQFDLTDIAALLERAKGNVILDEVYADFAADSALRLLPEHPNLFVARTFSKAWGLANLRIGFGASHSFAGVTAGSPRLPIMPNSVSGVAQRAARHLLADPRSVQEGIARTRECRERMRAALGRIPGLRVWPSEANYLCVETPLARTVAETLRASGYAVRLLHDLRDYPAEWPEGVRISVPPQPHLDAVLACVEAGHAPAAGQIPTAR